MNEELIIKFGFKKDNCCYHYRNNNNIRKELKRRNKNEKYN